MCDGAGPGPLGQQRRDDDLVGELALVERTALDRPVHLLHVDPGEAHQADR